MDRRASPTMKRRSGCNIQLQSVIERQKERKSIGYFAAFCYVKGGLINHYFAPQSHASRLFTVFVVCNNHLQKTQTKRVRKKDMYIPQRSGMSDQERK